MSANRNSDDRRFLVGPSLVRNQGFDLNKRNLKPTVRLGQVLVIFSTTGPIEDHPFENDFDD